MKFLITAKPEIIEAMKKDLDKEIEKIAKMQKSGHFKLASRIVEPLLKMPLILQISYVPVSYDKLELSVTMSAEMYMSREAIKKMITGRAKGYGDVKVEVIK